jgi:hypothetical protein
MLILARYENVPGQPSVIPGQLWPGIPGRNKRTGPLCETTNLLKLSRKFSALVRLARLARSPRWRR